MDTRATIANAFLAFPTQKKARFGTVTWMSLKLLPIWDSQALVSCAFPLVPLLVIELTSRLFNIDAGRRKLVALQHALHHRRTHIQHAFKVRVQACQV